jgi:hypothetical protein
MRKRSSKGGGAQRSIQVHLMVNEEEAAMIRAAARKRNQTVSLTIIEAVKLLEGSLYVEEEEHDSPTVQALREIEYQLRRIGRNVNQIAHNVNREMNAIILHGIPQSCRAKSLPINEIDMGVASDVNVYTFTRFAPRIGLLGRPRPHGRLRLQTARAACATTVFHLCDRGVTLVSTLFWRCCFGDLRAAARA